MEEKTDFIKRIIKENSLVLLSILTFLLVSIIIFATLDFFKSYYRKETLEEKVVLQQQPVKISTQKSKIYIECIYDQLECYSLNAGLNRDIIIDSCKPINYCDEESKK